MCSSGTLRWVNQTKQSFRPVQRDRMTGRPTAFKKRALDQNRMLTPRSDCTSPLGSDGRSGLDRHGHFGLLTVPSSLVNDGFFAPGSDRSSPAGSDGHSGSAQRGRFSLLTVFPSPGNDFLSLRGFDGHPQSNSPGLFGYLTDPLNGRECDCANQVQPFISADCSSSFSPSTLSPEAVHLGSHNRPKSRRIEPTGRSVRSACPDLARQARNLLVSEFEQKKNSAAAFPPVLHDRLDRESVMRYQRHLDSVIESMSSVCACCGLFVSKQNSRYWDFDNSELVDAMSAGRLNNQYLDCCGKRNSAYNMCNSCSGLVVRGKVPKFGSINGINMFACQNYPVELNDLTLVEEAVIARAHPIISILKLRPQGSGSAASYHRIRGHAVVLPQNLSRLSKGEQ